MTRRPTSLLLTLVPLIFLLVCTRTARAQEHPMHHDAMQDSGMSMQQPMNAMQMSSAILLTLPMERDGSGTSWLPDTSPMYALHGMAGSWSAMLHGDITLRYTAQDAFKSGTRGASRFDGPNWLMGMLSRPIGSSSQVAFRTMISLDRATEGGEGYPLLFQTGESWNGHKLVDNQHPHDLFMELAAAYSVSLGDKSALGLYLGYPGEPALGPPTYMHRPSARLLIDAPLSHHWQDATHISFGVATLGWQFHQIKLEGSLFTGHEPDENRWNFDKATMDSYSARLSCNPTEDLSFQVSRGYLKSPEPSEPGVDQLRTTASVVYGRQTGPGHYWFSTLVWGMNTLIGDKSQQSVLLESNIGLGPQALFGRFEAIRKSADELDLGGDSDRLFTVLALTLGTARTLFEGGLVNLSFGVQGTLYAVDTSLQPLYGKAPVSLEAFFHISPPLMQMEMSMQSHSHTIHN